MDVEEAKYVPLHLPISPSNGPRGIRLSPITKNPLRGFLLTAGKGMGTQRISQFCNWN